MSRPPTTLPHILLHPGLDLRHGLAMIGFRYRPTLKDERVVYVVATRGTLQYVHEPTFTLADRQYVVELGGRLLMPLERRLHPESLQAFVAAYTGGRPLPEAHPRAVFERVRGLIEQYVDLETASDSAIVAAWTIGTYFFPVFAAYPFLHVKAPKGSGKSQLLALLL